VAETNVELARRAFEGVLRGDLDVVKDLLAAANLSTFRGGKVVEIVHYPDPEDALAAAGTSARP
jgi:ketosteroid isomerase-like protein